MFAGKPIIGIVGGIGSGKSFVADLFAEMGCLVIKSDDQIRDAYNKDEVKRALRKWWGNEIFLANEEVNKQAVAERVFRNEGDRKRLEQLLHPMIASLRDEQMKAKADDPQVLAFVWDTPLLFEADLDRQCDAVIFVDAPLELRLARVKEKRGWNEEELLRRENLQIPLDKKQKMSDYVIGNTADEDVTRRQVRDVITQILAKR